MMSDRTESDFWPAKGVAMAAFREHIIFSSLLGGGYAAFLSNTGIETTHAVLAGGVCGVSGMLPDLDSASGKPVRELFGLTHAALVERHVGALQNTCRVAVGLTVAHE